MAADLDSRATVELLIDFGDVVALLGAIEWTSFVEGYRAYDGWSADNGGFTRGALSVKSLEAAPGEAKVA
jgi:hypothetical protein